ncbi:gp34 [Vibrio phage RYC]|nr:gp34 [Vibrio phage RYC]
MAMTILAKDIMLDHLVGRDLYLSAHEEDPLTDGRGEIGGSREMVSFGSASNGEVMGTTLKEIPIEATKTVTHLGIWDMETGGNFLVGLQLLAPETFENQGGLKANSVKVVLN